MSNRRHVVASMTGGLSSGLPRARPLAEWQGITMPADFALRNAERCRAIAIAKRANAAWPLLDFHQAPAIFLPGSLAAAGYRKVVRNVTAARILTDLLRPAWSPAYVSRNTRLIKAAGRGEGGGEARRIRKDNGRELARLRASGRLNCSKLTNHVSPSVSQATKR